MIPRGATLVGGSPDPVDVVVTAEHIARVGPPEDRADGDEPVTDVSGAMVFPSLLNSHGSPGI